MPFPFPVSSNLSLCAPVYFDGSVSLSTTPIEHIFTDEFTWYKKSSKIYTEVAVNNILIIVYVFSALTIHVKLKNVKIK